MISKNGKIGLLAIAVSVTALGLSTGADARGGLGAKVFITQTKIPKNLSERRLIQFARKNKARQLRETTTQAIDKRKWRANMVLAFNRPPQDLEFHVLFYDITGGQRVFVEDMATMVSDRSQKTYLQKLQLRRPRFKPNRRLEMVVTVRRVEVARAKIDIIGAEPKRSGVVKFSDDETK